MKKTVPLLLLTAAVLLAAPFAASANGDNRKGKFQLGAGAGFTLNPEGYTLGFEGEYYATNSISLAPKIGFASVDGGDLCFMSGEARFTMDIQGSQIERNFKPWVGTGVGLIAAIPDFPGADTDWGANFQMGAGFNYYFSQQFALGSNMELLFPFGIGDEHFVYRWQVLQMKVLIP